MWAAPRQVKSYKAWATVHGLVGGTSGDVVEQGDYLYKRLPVLVRKFVCHG